MRLTISVCLLVVLVLAPLAARGQDVPNVRKEHPNLVGGEIGGRAILYSLTFERFIIPQVGVGVGFTGFAASEAGVFLVPLHVSLVPVGSVHSLYLSGGATWVAAGVDNWKETESLWIGTATFGYLYQSRSGFFVRPSFNLLYHDDEGEGLSWVIWPGIQLGGSF